MRTAPLIGLLLLVATTAAAEPAEEAKETDKPVESWSALEPGTGFLVAKTDRGALYISAYGLIRYLNQLPEGQTYVAHLGREHPVDVRHDIWAHRIMIHLKGWLGLPKLRYQLTL